MAEYTQTKFDSKSFDPVAFGKYMERVPRVKQNELIKSKALTGNQQIKDAFSATTGTAFASIPMTGLLEGAADNYDGTTDITTDSTTTFERGVVVIGRAHSWTEKDFSSDITGGKDFMSNVGDQLGEWWDDVKQACLLSILKGIFSMTGVENKRFVDTHTYDISALEAEAGRCGQTTMNTATKQACGAKKKDFKIAIMHSEVSTNLENLNCVKNLTYTDANGITKDLTLATWNGKMVIIDDDMPTEEVPEIPAIAAKEQVGEEGKTGYTPAVEAREGVPGYTKYTTYVLGEGSLDFEPIGAKVPYAMSRDEKTNGGEDTLYTRDRFVFAPKGISYTKKSQAKLSPTNAELENAANWELVHNGESTKKQYINHKAIPIARIISRG